MMSKYGEEQMIALLRPHFISLCNYTGKQIPEDDVVRDIAQSLLQVSSGCGILIRELLHFFSLVKRATYGELTGTLLNGAKLLDMFQKHKKARSQSIRRVEEEQRRKDTERGVQRDGLANRIQYLRRLMFAKDGDEEAQRWFANIKTTDHYGKPKWGIPWWEDPRSMAELDAEIARLMKVQEEQKTAQDAQKGANEAINPSL